MFMFGFPRKIEYWMCSDKRTFPTQKEAEEHEAYLQRLAEHPEDNATCYTAKGLDPLDITF